MRKKEIIKSLISEFHYRELPEFIPRQDSIPTGLDKIITLVGPRRSGKTYRLYQVISELLARREKQSLVFLNFEDERLDLDVKDLDLILRAYRELYPDRDISACTFFFDELQNVDGWEQFIRRLYDTLCRRIYLTGSNAKMLSSEIASSLRGRSVSYTIYPLSFKEFLCFKKIEYNDYIPEIKAMVNNALDAYIRGGGFPELVHVEDEVIRCKILQEYYQVMLFRDLVEHYRLTNIVALKFFLKRLFASSAKEISVNRIYNDLKSANIQIGKNSLYSFLDYAESIFLVATLPKFSRKLSIREFGERKIYAIDTGLLNAVVYKFTEDKGKAVEQIVYWELMRRGKQLFFLKNGFECDFITMAPNGDLGEILQVSIDLSDPHTRKRELKGLGAACRKLGLHCGTIITLDEEDTLSDNGIDVSLVPLAQYLCGPG